MDGCIRYARDVCESRKREREKNGERGNAFFMRLSYVPVKIIIRGMCVRAQCHCPHFVLPGMLLRRYPRAGRREGGRILLLRVSGVCCLVNFIFDMTLLLLARWLSIMAFGVFSKFDVNV